jgi:Zn-finger nucleic acid-binding protein
MLRVCRECTTRYAVGLDRCPHCSADDAGNVDEGELEAEVAAVEADDGATRTQKIRVWARANGYDVADSGAISKEIQSAYDDAQEDAAG